MIKKLSLKDMQTVKKILELQKISYEVEAEIIEFYEIPPLKDTIASLSKCNENFYGYFINNILAGIISYKTTENILDIHRVAVHPHFFRMGIAGKLLDFVEGFEKDLNKAVVCTGKKNLPAINLYLKNKYQKIQDIKISENIYLTKFEKMLQLKK
ncbi:acetyltransferase, GNAT family [Gottschalkia acidurici 9a]|uniref:Acetyltransferase, GNAT family n=1 Tax=Gottschalkia acidurici (strain ATCC 7906 / DSM 604 / BCRC 14475 / CIP 104303 / KCTC 5404 / NCIMB 10678 / 9a) TaxID=1128398 RepID=K0B1C9_GOTA9|nr:GNAT family N-acetyltransferase [Gottschalkia acidurici]AFS78456.1 acetyltransferase, GNAT family [Gottschalkia acidurici 9a]